MIDLKNRDALEIYILSEEFKFYQNIRYLPLPAYSFQHTIGSDCILFERQGKAHGTRGCTLDTAEGTYRAITRTVCLIQ